MTNRNIEYWVIPPKADAEFVAHMEEVLETYEKPHNPPNPLDSSTAHSRNRPGHAPQVVAPQPKLARAPITRSAGRLRIGGLQGCTVS